MIMVPRGDTECQIVMLRHLEARAETRRLGLALARGWGT